MTRLKSIIQWATLILSVGLPEARAQGVPPAIATIKSRFAQIARQTPSYRAIRLDMDSAGFERGSTDGGEVVAYFDDGEIRRATTTYFGEHGSAVYDIYFEDRKPFFAYVVEKTSGEKLYGPQHVERELRIYLDNGSLIRFMTGQKIQPVTARESVKMTNIARELARDIVRRVK